MRMRMQGGVVTRVFTLACPKCCQGWESPHPRATCPACRAVVDERGSYLLINLAGVER